MDQKRKVPTAIKRQLVAEAGGKCANPGCTNQRTEIHHIAEWAVYKRHDTEEMVAICPTCHDHAHHGRLKISNDRLREWKEINRAHSPRHALLNIEPGPGEVTLAVGQLEIVTDHDQVVVLEMARGNRLALRLLDGDLLQVTSALFNRVGDMVLRVVENNIRVSSDSDVTLDSRPGRTLVTVPADERYIPEWVVAQVRQVEPDYASDGRVTALDLEVLRPGVVRVMGFWADRYFATVVTDKHIYFCDYLSDAFIGFGAYGDGAAPRIVYSGPIGPGAAIIANRTLATAFGEIFATHAETGSRVQQELQFKDGSALAFLLNEKAPQMKVSGSSTYASRFRSVVRKVAPVNQGYVLILADDSKVTAYTEEPAPEIVTLIERDRNRSPFMGLSVGPPS